MYLRLLKTLQTLMEKHLVYRIALDLGKIQLLHSMLLGQLVSLKKTCGASNGTTCGASAKGVGRHLILIGG